MIKMSEQVKFIKLEKNLTETSVEKSISNEMQEWLIWF